MKNLNVITSILAIGLIHTGSAYAIAFDQDVTTNVIMGTGITNGSFTVDQNNGIELGLRGKLRHNASGAAENTFNSNGDGTYSFDAGVAPTQSSSTAVWSFEWSINSNYGGSGNFLDQYTYKLGLDSDPSLGTSLLEFDVINAFNSTQADGHWDHAIGDNSTAQSAGVSAGNIGDYTTYIAGNNLAQNSWKPSWFLSGFDPTVDGTYDFFLAAYDMTGTTELARTEMQIIVGAGGVAVPEPSILALLSAGLLGLIGVARRKKA